MKKFILISLTIIGILTGCKDAEKTKIPEEKTPVSNSTTEDMHEIVVLENIASGGYLYLKVKEKDKEYWIAATGIEGKIGTTYYYNEGMEMGQFESKSLNRTFESIVFVNDIRNQKEKIEKVKKSVPQKGTSKVADIDKATNGIRIATLFENPKEYQNKEVIIKAQVVKVNNGIMGVNFVHLQDGTKGNEQFDLTITSNEEFNVGDVVTIKGTVVLDKDFGSSYAYDLLIEKAVIL